MVAGRKNLIDDGGKHIPSNSRKKFIYSFPSKKLADVINDIS